MFRWWVAVTFAVAGCAADAADQQQGGTTTPPTDTETDVVDTGSPPTPPAPEVIEHRFEVDCEAEFGIEPPGEALMRPCDDHEWTAQIGSTVQCYQVPIDYRVDLDSPPVSMTLVSLTSSWALDYAEEYGIDVTDAWISSEVFLDEDDRVLAPCLFATWEYGWVTGSVALVVREQVN